MLRLGVLSFTLLILLVSCEAVRDNPLDPLSPMYKDEGRIVGWVATVIGEPVSGATVLLEPQYIFEITDDSGFFEFELPSGSSKIIVSKEGFAEDSLFVEVEVGKEDTLFFTLDMLPCIAKTRITTTHELDVISGIFIQKYYVAFETEIRIGDGHIVSADVLVKDDEIFDTFNLEIKSVTDTTMTWNTTVNMQKLDLEALMGRDCFFQVTDRTGKQVTSNPLWISRIIYESPVTLEPIQGDTLDKKQPLKWEKTNLSYDYFHMAQVMRISGDSEVEAWSDDSIPKYQVETDSLSFEAGTYYWMLWIVDKFGNNSRSQMDTFYVR